MTRLHLRRLGTICFVVSFCCAAIPALAEQSGSQPEPQASPSPSPSPKKTPLEKAQDQTEEAAKAAARDAKAYRDICGKAFAEGYELEGTVSTLKGSNAELDEAIKKEVSEYSEVKEADAEFNKADADQKKIESNKDGAASDLFEADKKLGKAKKKADNVRKEREKKIRKRLADAGYIFTVPAECKKEDVAPGGKKEKPDPKRKPVNEDSPLYMDGYKAPASNKPATHKKNNDGGTGPSQDDVDRQTEQPSNDNDRNPEIPIPH